jgi:DNA-binding transcriptional LysR family regulator
MDQPGELFQVELRQVDYFVTLAEELHFGRAAERLHVVQPAVSQQIQRLERELGVQLFDRTRRRVSLTRAGERLLPEAYAVLASVKRAVDTVTDPGEGEAPVLRIGTTEGLGERLDVILAKLRELRQEVQVSLHSVPNWARLEHVRDGQLDAALVRLVKNRKGVELIPVWQERLVAVLPAGHRLAGKPALALRELAELPLRLVPREANPAFFDFVLQACRDAGFEPRLDAPFTTLQNTFAEIGVGQASWTLMYEGIIGTVVPKRVAFRRLLDPEVTIPTSLAVRSVTPLLENLAEACRFAAEPAGTP